MTVLDWLKLGVWALLTLPLVIGCAFIWVLAVLMDKLLIHEGVDASLRDMIYLGFSGFTDRSHR